MVEEATQETKAYYDHHYEPRMDQCEEHHDGKVATSLGILRIEPPTKIAKTTRGL